MCWRHANGMHPRFPGRTCGRFEDDAIRFKPLAARSGVRMLDGCVRRRATSAQGLRGTAYQGRTGWEMNWTKGGQLEKFQGGQTGTNKEKNPFPHHIRTHSAMLALSANSLPSAPWPMPIGRGCLRMGQEHGMSKDIVV